MNEKHDQFDFSKEEDQARFSALSIEDQKKIINHQQGEANLFEQRIGFYRSQQMLGAELYMRLGETEKAKEIFNKMAESTRNYIENHDARVKAILTDVAEFLAKGSHVDPPYRVQVDNFNFQDINNIAVFLGHEVIKNANYQAVELATFNERTYLLCDDGQIRQVHRDMQHTIKNSAAERTEN